MINPDEVVRLSDGRLGLYRAPLASGELVVDVRTAAPVVGLVQWSSEQPTCDGRYWMRRPNGAPRFVRVVGVERNLPKVESVDLGVRELGAYASCEWIGPLDDEGRP